MRPNRGERESKNEPKLHKRAAVGNGSVVVCGRQAIVFRRRGRRHGRQLSVHVLNVAVRAQAAQVLRRVAIVAVKNVGLGVRNDGGKPTIVRRGDLVERGIVLQTAQGLENASLSLFAKIAIDLVLQKID